VLPWRSDPEADPNWWRGSRGSRLAELDELGSESVNTGHGRTRNFPTAAAAAATAAAAADANTAAYPGRLTHANLNGVEAVAAAAAAVVDAVWLTQQETAPAPHSRSAGADGTEETHNECAWN